MMIVAQAIGEYGGASSGGMLGGWVAQVGSAAMRIVDRLDTQTWLILGGVVLVLVLVTRRSSRS